MLALLAADDVEVVDVPRAGGDCGHDHVVAEAQFGIAGGDRDAAVVPAVDEGAQLQQDGGLQLVEARVVADLRERLLVLRAVEAEDAADAVDLGARRRDQAAVAEARQVLGGEEGERGGIADRAAADAVERGAVGLRRVLQQRQPVPLADLRERPHRGRVAEQVHRHDRARARRDRGLHGGGIEVERLVLDVGEHGHRTDRGDRLGRCVERERRADDLIAGLDAQRAQRDQQRVRAVADADPVRHAQMLGERALDLGDPRAEDEAARLDHLGDRAGDLLAHLGVLRMRVHQGDGHVPDGSNGLFTWRRRASRSPRCPRPCPRRTVRPDRLLRPSR